MGFFDIFKSKYDKIKRSEVVDAICALEKQQAELLNKVGENNVDIKKYFDTAKKDASHEMRVFYSKKISLLKQNNTMTGKRLQYLNSNLNALEQLKSVIDDKEFLDTNAKLSLNQMLAKPDKLRSFVASVMNKKMVQEERLGAGLEVFDEVNSEYLENDKIYGVDETADQILAMIESSCDDAIDDEVAKINEEENKLTLEPKQEKKIAVEE